LTARVAEVIHISNVLTSRVRLLFLWRERLSVLA
jgi:hypothetical protein